MTTVYVAAPAGLLVLAGRNGGWDQPSQPEVTAPQCLAIDPLRPERVWCGTATGLWRSDDAGGAWRRIPGPLAGLDISAIAVSPNERAGDEGVVYAGADPTALHRSADGGATWEELAGLRSLPSAPTWSFPPRPDTSHVRWITPDPAEPGRVNVCIEAGALVRTLDGGRTWIDRTADGPYDTHTLAAHPAAPGRLYSAAGDGFQNPGRGYSESHDGGETWERPDDGLERHYLWGAAVDCSDPDTMVVSAASSPREAHLTEAADSCVYRRSGGGAWRPVRAGLPEPMGTTAFVLAAHPTEAAVFYAASNRGLFVSHDAGEQWTPVPAPWPDGHRAGRVNALVVA